MTPSHSSERHFAIDEDLGAAARNAVETRGSKTFEHGSHRQLLELRKVKNFFR